tara:strand:- start:216 stop:491 length:276 start_codon:yes stop_codon:yes gene_type:complete
LKVNISYAVELEDIPSEVGKLLASCEFALDRLRDELGSISCSDPISAIGIIEEVRKELAGLDLRLNDSRQILSGYVDLKSKNTMSPEESSE